LVSLVADGAAGLLKGLRLPVVLESRRCKLHLDAAGALDQPTGLTSEVHIFFADKPDYYEIADDLPKFVQDDG